MQTQRDLGLLGLLRRALQGSLQRLPYEIRPGVTPTIFELLRSPENVPSLALRSCAGAVE